MLRSQMERWVSIQGGFVDIWGAVQQDAHWKVPALPGRIVQWSHAWMGRVDWWIGEWDWIEGWRWWTGEIGEFNDNSEWSGDDDDEDDDDE